MYAETIKLNFVPSLASFIELVDWTVEKLTADVFVMLQHWDSPDALGICLRNAYELLQMEMGLEGNIFSLDFKVYGCLATHSWMKILWNYLDHLDVQLVLDPSTNVPDVREGNAGIMELLVAHGWSGSRLTSVNRVRMFKQVHRLSCLVNADGYSVSEDLLTRNPGSSLRVWSVEMPTASDFRLWKQALQVVFGTSTLNLYSALGPLVGTPHIANEWSCNLSRDVLCRQINEGSFAIYKPSQLTCFSRRGLPFEFHSYSSINPATEQLATVLIDEGSIAVKLHSASPYPSLPDPISPFWLYSRRGQINLFGIILL